MTVGQATPGLALLDRPHPSRQRPWKAEGHCGRRRPWCPPHPRRKGSLWFRQERDQCRKQSVWRFNEGTVTNSWHAH